MQQIRPKLYHKNVITIAVFVSEDIKTDSMYFKLLVTCLMHFIFKMLYHQWFQLHFRICH